jgi:hypothetical protein
MSFADGSHICSQKPQLLAAGVSLNVAQSLQTVLFALTAVTNYRFRNAMLGVFFAKPILGISTIRFRSKLLHLFASC